MNARLVASMLPFTLLAACSGGTDEPAETDAMDPAMEQALNDELMTDPDMAGRNEAGAALSGTGNGAVPNIDTSPRVIEAARTRAVELVGGADALRPAPVARKLADNAPDSAAMVAAARAVVAPGGENCAAKVSYTTGWAAKLPPEFPVYPRANTQEAAGTDEGACALRAVTFHTPVPLHEVLAFYASRAAAAGYSVDHATKQGDNVLSGTRGGSAFVVYARVLGGKVTELDLVTSTQ